MTFAVSLAQPEGGIAMPAIAQQAQHLHALDRANRLRLTRARFKRDELRSAPDRPTAWARAADVIEEPPEEFEGMRVGELLDACRRTGPALVHRLLRGVGASELRKLGELSDRQRRALASMLRAAGAAQRRAA